MTEYHHMFVVDNNYLFYMFVTMQSILDNLENKESDSQDHIIFNVVTDLQLDQQRADFYVQAFTKFNAEAKIKFSINFHKINPEIFEGCCSLERFPGRFSLSTYYRILFSKVLPTDIHRLLYLDIDLLVNTDTRNIFQQYPMQDEILYASSEPFYLSTAVDPKAAEPIRVLKPRADGEKPYIVNVRKSLQAGVMLINVDQWRNLNVEQQCLDITSKWVLPFFDQDALSIVCQDKLAYLDWDCNFSTGMFWLSKYGKGDFNGVILPFDRINVNHRPTLEQMVQMSQNPKIVHFAGEFKPWTLTHKLTEKDQNSFQDVLPFMYKWLTNYGSLSQYFKQAKAAL